METCNPSLLHYEISSNIFKGDIWNKIGSIKRSNLLEMARILWKCSKINIISSECAETAVLMSCQGRLCTMCSHANHLAPAQYTCMATTAKYSNSKENNKQQPSVTLPPRVFCATFIFWAFLSNETFINIKLMRLDREHSVCVSDCVCSFRYLWMK